MPPVARCNMRRAKDGRPPAFALKTESQGHCVNQPQAELRIISVECGTDRPLDVGIEDERRNAPLLYVDVDPPLGLT